MAISRDEAREVAVIALLIAATFRVAAGGVKLLHELTVGYTLRSLLDQFFGPIGTTPGIFVLGAVLLIVLSPAGSVSAGLLKWVRRGTTGIFVLGMVSSTYMLLFSYSVFWSRWWIPLMNGLPTAVLAGAGWWILRNFDEHR